jgi:DUF1365 family protein
MHHRFAPAAHRFDYRLFYFAIDLDELATLHRRLGLLSVNRANLYSLREADFFPTAERLHPAPAPAAPPVAAPRELKARVLRWLAEQGVALPDGRVLLVTLPRIAGYLFNPVSFYFCFDRAGRPVTAIAEVTNTFREVKLFHVRRGADDRTFHLRAPKNFYVSPFSAVDVEFDFTLRVPGERLSVQIDDYCAGERTLVSTLHGSRRALSNARLAWFAVKYPLLSLRVIALIHWHALRLWGKRLPWFAKAARAEAQRDLYRPHSSLVPSKP